MPRSDPAVARDPGRGPAIITLVGLVAAVGAHALFGLISAGAVALATLCYAASGRPTMGTTTLPVAASVDPAEVRRYRIEQPGTSISAAAAAVASGK